MPIFGHEPTPNPQDRHSIFTSEKWGAHALLFNLKKGIVTASAVLGTGRRFFGHGVFSKDGQLIFSAEMDDLNSRAYIGVRDPESLKLISEITTGGINAHQVRWLPNSNLIAVANSGWIPRKTAS